MRSVYLDYENISKRKAKRIAKKLYKMNKKEDIVIALSNYLEKNEDLIKYIKKFNLKILNGRWLFKFLLLDILEYISRNQNKNLEMLTVAILIERPDEIVMAQFVDIAKKVKCLKIVTQDVYRFSYIEEELYEKYGIALQITNNKQKSLSNVDIIINFDFDEEKINEYNINRTDIIVNISKNINIYKAGFKGKNINNYEIKYNEENYGEVQVKSKYNPNVLYESYIYRRDTFANVYKQLKRDGVEIANLA